MNDDDPPVVQAVAAGQAAAGRLAVRTRRPEGTRPSSTSRPMAAGRRARWSGSHRSLAGAATGHPADGVSVGWDEVRVESIDDDSIRLTWSDYPIASEYAVMIAIDEDGRFGIQVIRPLRPPTRTRSPSSASSSSTSTSRSRCRISTRASSRASAREPAPGRPSAATDLDARLHQGPGNPITSRAPAQPPRSSSSNGTGSANGSAIVRGPRAAVAGSPPPPGDPGRQFAARTRRRSRRHPSPRWRRRRRSARPRRRGRRTAAGARGRARGSGGGAAGRADEHRDAGERVRSSTSKNSLNSPLYEALKIGDGDEAIAPSTRSIAAAQRGLGKPVSRCSSGPGRARAARPPRSSASTPPVSDGARSRGQAAPPGGASTRLRRARR